MYINLYYILYIHIYKIYINNYFIVNLYLNINICICKLYTLHVEYKIYIILTVWEVSTGRCLKTVPCGGVIRSVAWCPNQTISLIAVAADKKVLLINPGVGDDLISSKTDQLLEIIPQSEKIGINNSIIKAILFIYSLF